MANTRNKPCPCGSGKKHKKCCLVPPIMTIEEFFKENWPDAVDDIPDARKDRK